jgi:hypothetical protein
MYSITTQYHLTGPVYGTSEQTKNYQFTVSVAWINVQFIITVSVFCIIKPDQSVVLMYFNNIL